MVKRFIVFTAVLILFFISCKRTVVNQTEFVIDGKVNDLDGTEVQLIFIDKVLDKTTIENGKFSLKGSLWDKQICQISFRKKEVGFDKNGFKYDGWSRFINIFVEANASYTFVAQDKDELLQENYQLITDSKIHNEYQDFERLRRKRFHEAQQNLDELETKRTTVLNKGDLEGYRDYSEFVRIQQAELDNVFKRARHEHILKDPNSVVSVYLLSKGTDINKNVGFYKFIDKKLSEKVADHPYTKLFRKKLHVADQLNAGKQQISFTAKSLTGDQLHLKDFTKSKLIVLDFWATWCEPCMQEMPSSLKLQKELFSHGVSFIYIGYMERREDNWKQKSLSLGLINSYILDAGNKLVADLELNISSIPRYVIINPEGRVLASEAPWPSNPALKELILDLLNK